MQIGVESSRSVKNKRIFVVDSNEIDRAVLQFMLQDENETHELPSLEAALLKARAWRPDLILLGLDLVRENGLGAPSQIMVDKAHTIPRDKAGAPFGELETGTLSAVNRALAVILGLG